MRFKLPLSALAVAVSLSPLPLEAQGCFFETGTSCQVIHRADASVPTVAELVMSTTGTTFIVNRAVYLAGQADAAGPDLTVSANKAWTLAVRSTATWAAPTGVTKPASDLLISVNSGPHLALSATDQQVASGGAGANPAVPTQLRSLWSFANDPQGGYNISLVFTLAAP